MATKYELAEYLVNLNTLITAQFESARAHPSTTLVKEYERGWDELKDLINQEQTDETRTINEPTGEPEEGADFLGDRPRRS